MALERAQCLQAGTCFGMKAALYAAVVAGTSPVEWGDTERARTLIGLLRDNGFHK